MKRPRTNKEHLQIFVGGLPNSNEQALKEAFTRFGKVTDALIMIHHETKKPRGKHGAGVHSSLASLLYSLWSLVTKKSLVKQH